MTTKKELALIIAETNDISQTKAGEMIDAVIGGIVASLKDGDGVVLRGFGAFKLVHTAARSGRNLRTSERVKIPAKIRIKFKSYLGDTGVAVNE